MNRAVKYVIIIILPQVLSEVAILVTRWNSMVIIGKLVLPTASPKEDTEKYEREEMLMLFGELGIYLKMPTF